MVMLDLLAPHPVLKVWCESGSLATRGRVRRVLDSGAAGVVAGRVHILMSRDDTCGWAACRRSPSRRALQAMAMRRLRKMRTTTRRWTPPPASSATPSSPRAYPRASACLLRCGPGLRAGLRGSARLRALLRQALCNRSMSAARAGGPVSCCLEVAEPAHALVAAPLTHAAALQDELFAGLKCQPGFVCTRPELSEDLRTLLQCAPRPRPLLQCAARRG